MGLASSEPLRQAAIAIEGEDSLLNDSIKRVMLTRRSRAVNHSLKDLRLREHTGASVIGVYRDGGLRANPSADTILQPNDILVLIGDAKECRDAEHFLSSK